MPLVARTDLLELFSEKSNSVASSAVRANSFRLDASAFLSARTRASSFLVASSGQLLADIANVFTVYIQTPILHYVTPFAQSRPYLTTSELGEYQRGLSTHVSLLTDPRLIDWQITRGTIILSRSGRVGETYWVDKTLADALVGDSFRVVPKNQKDAYFIYALLASTYARDYLSGATYGSVVDHASVDQVRSLPLPAISNRHRARVTDLIQQAIFARDAAYDLLDAAEAELLQINGLNELREPKAAPFDPFGRPECLVVDAKTVRAAKGDGSEYRLDAHFHSRLAQLAIASIKTSRSEVKTVADVTEHVLMGPRFKRNYVEATHGVPFLSGKNIVQSRPNLKYLSMIQMENMQELLVRKSWTLVTCSGTIGRTCFVWKNYEDYAVSQHVLRVIPDESEIDPGYLYAFLSCRYGYEQILRYRHGSVIDEVTDTQIEQVWVPRPSRKDQTIIGDKIRAAYEKRAEAIHCEDEAQTILMNELHKAQGTKGA